MEQRALERVLPFAAIVGQPELKQALVLAATNPRLGGVLIRGQKGTAKSTAARALAAVLPTVAVVEGCRFGCPLDRPESWCDGCREREGRLPAERRPPFVTVPLGVTEDQLVGSIDLEQALKHGEQRFSPGLLAAANGGVLYVDEVNLLEDHSVDLLLDAAAMGVNVVAREGVRLSHPAEFTLVGTMNPEEGELRPQLLDRFGLCVEVRGLPEPRERAEVIRRALAFEADPGAFHRAWAQEQRALTVRIARARELVSAIEPDEASCLGAARIAVALEVHGHRADVLMVKAAIALAALAGRTELCGADLEAAATVVLPHRLRRQPFEQQPMVADELRARVRQVLSGAAGGDGPRDAEKKS